MFERILVPVDGSAPAMKAAEVAREFLNRDCTKKVILLHVTLNPQDAFSFENLYPRVDLPHFHENLMTRLEESSNHILAQARGIFDPDIPVETMIQYGPPAEIICEVAQAQEIDLIVIGNRGLNKLQQLFQGSVSSKVTSLAKCPVLVVK